MSWDVICPVLVPGRFCWTRKIGSQRFLVSGLEESYTQSYPFASEAGVFSLPTTGDVRPDQRFPRVLVKNLTTLGRNRTHPRPVDLHMYTVLNDLPCE